MICKNAKCRKEIEDDSAFCRFCGKEQNKARNARTRANGHGTVYQLPNKKWRAEKTAGYECEGSEVKRRIVYTRSDFTKKSDAIAYLPILGTALDVRTRYVRKPTAIETDVHLPTLKELYDKWEPTCTASEKTIKGYRSAFKVFSDVWNVPIAEQDIDDLQECLDEFEPTKGTDGKRTRQLAKTALGLVYKYAIPRDHVPKDRNLSQYLNVVAGARVFKPGFSTEELEKIRNGVGKVPYADYIYCHCYLGFRITAFLDLTMNCYDAKEKALTGGIKTEAGKNRIVTISPKIQPAFDTIINGRDSGYVFCNPEGKRFDNKKYRAAFYELLEKLGIENPVSEYGTHKLTPHSCRHTFSTLMKRVDAPAKDKLELMGHTSEEMLAYYQDVNYEDLRRITDRI